MTKVYILFAIWLLVVGLSIAWIVWEVKVIHPMLRKDKHLRKLFGGKKI